MPVRRKRATSRKRAKTPVRRRRLTTTTTKTKKKRKTASKKFTASDAQLAVYMNPFARITKQPKIPDGKTTESLGFSTQAVRELQVNNGTAGAVHGIKDQMHILLFGGQNCGCLVWNDQASAFVDFDTAGTAWTVNYYAGYNHAIGYTDSNDFNTNGITGAGAGSSGLITREDKYAMWRLVSQGMRLSLLNNDEENEGWWEACRIYNPCSVNDWIFSEHDAAPGDKSAYTVIPHGVMNKIVADDISNTNSYSTGLLRDIGKVAFKLNPIKEEHDPQWQRASWSPDSEVADYKHSDTPGAGTEGHFFTFNAGANHVKNYLEEIIDQSHDMVYVRIHGRDTGAGGALMSSKLHLNVISNQEIMFENDERESRFQSLSFKHSKMGHALNAAKTDVNRAHHVPP